MSLFFSKKKEKHVISDYPIKPKEAQTELANTFRLAANSRPTIKEYKNDIAESAERMRERLHIRDEKLLRSASCALLLALDRGYELPWWRYIDELRGFVDWLYMHSLDVAFITLLVAGKMKHEKNLDCLAVGALLHDIGKLRIPVGIIQKPASLTDDELVLMRRHCEFGLSMLKPHDLGRICEDIVYLHHEKQNGDGYPLGLLSNECSKFPKIVMMADILEAITAYRPYKAACPVAEAFVELANETLYPQDIRAILEKIIPARG